MSFGSRCCNNLCKRKISNLISPSLFQFYQEKVIARDLKGYQRIIIRWSSKTLIDMLHYTILRDSNIKRGARRLYEVFTTRRTTRWCQKVNCISCNHRHSSFQFRFSIQVSRHKFSAAFAMSSAMSSVMSSAMATMSHLALQANIQQQVHQTKSHHSSLNIFTNLKSDKARHCTMLSPMSIDISEVFKCKH